MLLVKKMAVLFFVICLFVLASSTILVAGGGMQQRLQQKINTRSDIQYNLDNLNEAAQDMRQVSTGAEEGFDYNDKPQELKKAIGRVRGKEGKAPSSSAAVLPPSPISSSYAIYNTNYKAEIEEDVATVKGTVLFEVFRRGWTQLPLVRSSVGLINVSINRGASFVTMQGGRYYLMIDKPGRYRLDIEFLIKASRERENGPGSFSFEVMPAPISQFEFTMPESGVDIFVEPAIKVETRREAKRTVAWAIMPNTDTITARWTKALPKETITPVKLEPKVYVDTATYASVGEGLIRCSTSLSYSILQSEISNLRVVLPEDVSVLDVQGNNLRDWKVSSKEGQQYLDVYLTFGVKGSYVLYLTYERKIGEGSVVAQIPEVKALGVEREKGHFGLAAATNVELAANKIEHATLIDVKELPSYIWGSSTSPILLAFKYLSHPFSIAIEVTRHEELPVLVAAIDSVDFVTLQTDEGKSLTKAVYQVRNNSQQFMRLVLPRNADLWSVFVAGKPVKPGKDKDGSVSISLEKSQSSGESLTQFPVEIVYLDSIPKMGLLGNLKIGLPKSDIPINELNWSVYLPTDYLYFNFGGDVKQVKGYGHVYSGLLQSSLRVSGGQMRDRKSKERYPGTQVTQGQYSMPAININQEVESAKMKGVLPIRVSVPEAGHLYRFSKLLVTKKESPTLRVNFITVFKQVHGLIRFLIWVLVLLFIGKIVKKRLNRQPKL